MSNATVLRVVIPVNRRVVRLYFKELTGNLIEKADQIKDAEKCAEWYRRDHGLPVSKTLPPTQYQTFRVSVKDFDGLFDGADDRRDNDNFFYSPPKGDTDG